MLCLQNYTKELPVNTTTPIVLRKRGTGRGRTVQSGAEQSSCSEGSLLSAGSSEPEDDCRSSKGDLASVPLTLLASISSIPDVSDQDIEEPPSGLAPLSHSAARHKMAVRPRRTHGPPRRNKNNQMSPGTLPTTPEVNEEVTRSTTPEVISLTKSEITSSKNISVTSSEIHHLITVSSKKENIEILSQSSENSFVSDDINPNQVPNETKVKSLSLPSGLALSQLVGQSGNPIKFSLSSNDEMSQSSRINRSKSNVQHKENRDIDEQILYDQQQSEKSISYHYITKQTYKVMDSKFVDITGELQKKFNSVHEDEDILKSEIKHKKYNDNINGKNLHSDNIQSNEKDKSKQHNHNEEHQEKSNKKEESFFGRLLLRKSGKKNKKDQQNEKDDNFDTKKMTTKEQLYKNMNVDSFIVNQKYNLMEHSVSRQSNITCSDEHVHKTIGHEVFTNQNHKRIDPGGGYTNDPLILDSLNYSKNSIQKTGKSDIKYFSEYEKSIYENQFSHLNLRNDDVNSKRINSENTQKGNIPQPRIRQRIEPLDIPISPDITKKPTVAPRTLMEPKSFFPIINQGKVYPSQEGVNGCKFIKNTNSLHKNPPKDDIQQNQTISTKFKMNSDIFSFSSLGGNSSLMLTDNSTKQLSYSVSPPKSIWPQKNDNTSCVKSSSQGSLDQKLLKNSKTDYNKKYFDLSPNNEFENDNSKSKPKIAGLTSYQQKIINSQVDLGFDNTCDIINPRNSINKSHSFRINSEISNTSQDMPSLPSTLGMSEPVIDSWETNYKKNLKDVTDNPTSLELGSDSLMNYTFKPTASVPGIVYSDDSLMSETTGDSLKTNIFEKQNSTSHYIKHASMVSKVRDNDISRIEANIDSIIGSPKPLNCITLKSSSLDSVKSFAEKSPEQNRKAISSESISQNKIIINHPDLIGSISFTQPSNNPVIIDEITNVQKSTNPASNEKVSESHVSVTVLNSTEDYITNTSDKISEKLSESNIDKTSIKAQTLPKDTKNMVNSNDSSVPEFMKIQLNKVDQKLSNVVLTTSVIIDNKSSKVINKNEKNIEYSYDASSKKPDFERSISHEPKKAEKQINIEVKRSESSSKNLDNKDIHKPQRKFSSEDVEILEKSDTCQTIGAFNISLKKQGSQALLNKSNEILNVDNSNLTKNTTDTKLSVPTNLNLRKSGSSVNTLPPLSPTSNKNFIRKKSDTDTDSLKRSTSTNESKMDTSDQVLNKISSQEMLNEQIIRNDRSSSSSDDTNLESTVILRKKSMLGFKNNIKKDDEPELMKVFARRSLKLKDSESDALAQDILNASNIENKDEDNDENKKKVKHTNVISKSRDSDKENEVDSPKDERKKSLNDTIENTQVLNNIKVNTKNLNDYWKHNDSLEVIQTRIPKKLLDSNSVTPVNNSNSSRLSGSYNYQRSVSATIPFSQTTAKLENNSSNFKKDVSDSTPEKRLRNRTFPDANNEVSKEEGIKNLSIKTDYVDTSSLPKRPWNQIKYNNDTVNKDDRPIFRKTSYISLSDAKNQISNKINLEKPNSDIKEISEKQLEDTCLSENDNIINEGQTDDSPQFKGILQMRAEWERRAQQAMTK